MIEKLNQYKKLIGAVFLTLLVLVGIGYLFADKKSEPVYLSKIDKLMFDDENKAPKFILTLPDYQPGKKNEVVEKKPEVKEPKIEIDKVPESKPKPAKEKKKELTMDDVLATVPSVSKLGSKDPTQSLRHINLNEKLTEINGDDRLPKISDNGKKPWIQYGKSVKVKPNFKRVAIVVKGLGFDEGALDMINKGFASEVSFSFSPYAQNSDKKIIPVRQQGHETYVDMLLASKDFLKSDSGPMSMSLTISSDESINRLKKSLNVGAPIGGGVVNDGVADESNSEILQKLMEELKTRGLLMIDATSGNGLENISVPGLARKKANFVIEDLLDKKLINQVLKMAENMALEKGQVLIVVESKPVILTAVNDWIKTFSPQVDYKESKNTKIEKPLALVPVSNLVVE